jgi:hypothetical protein
MNLRQSIIATHLTVRRLISARVAARWLLGISLLFPLTDRPILLAEGGGAGSALGLTGSYPVPAAWKVHDRHAAVFVYPRGLRR